MKVFKGIKALLVGLSIILFILISNLFVNLIGKLKNFQYKNEIIIKFFIIVILIIILIIIVSYIFIKEKVINNVKEKDKLIRIRKKNNIYKDIMVSQNVGSEIENELKEALEREEFEVYYQPIYDLKSNRIVEAEALIRWIRKGEVIPPMEFIPLAKKNGEIVKIDQFVVKKAAKYCKKLKDLGEKDFKISVNISHVFLKQSYAVDLMTELVKEEGIEPESIKIEITEDETIEDIDYAKGVLYKLKDIGFTISLDDFGVGYSSFNYLKILPLDTLKIDKSLLISIENDKKTILIMKMLIKLAHTLDLDIVCEGVEEKDQMHLLKKLDCNKIQGYYISRPIREEEFDKFIIKTNKFVIS